MEPQPLAYQDQAFLDSEDGRPLRILAEYLEPLRRFKAENIQDTVVFFGSARTLSREGAERELQKLGTDEAKKAADYEAALKRGRKALDWSRYYEDARELAHLLTVWGCTSSSITSSCGSSGSPISPRR
jgi:predicted Rossmann-fold nucleotide-binding protein